MTTAVDSSVLLAILNGEPGASAWVRALAQARMESRLVLCSIVYAECSPSLDSNLEFDDVLTRLGIALDPIHSEAAHLAGQLYIRYRRSGGPRQHLIPDFLIGAHALAQADRLAATDRGYLRQYFPTLTLLLPAPEEEAPDSVPAVMPWSFAPSTLKSSAAAKS